MLQLAEIKPARRAENVRFAIMIDDESNIFIRNPIQNGVHVLSKLLGRDMLHLSQ